MTRAPLVLVPLLVSLASLPVTAQTSLADAAAEAAKVKHEWPLSTNLGTPPPPPLTAAELADLDKTKFDKVYAAGKAMVDAPKYEAGLAAALVTRQANLAFKSEVSMAVDKATTKAEKALAAKYAEAQWRFELDLAPERHLSRDAWKAALDKAYGVLDAADRMYLGKEPKP